MSAEELGLHVMLLEDWPKYGRTRQSVKQPVQVYETMVLSILCYNSETWTLTAETNYVYCYVYTKEMEQQLQ